MSTYKARKNAANRFGISPNKLLATSALTAAGLLALSAGPAQADNWVDLTTTSGSTTTDLSQTNTTNLGLNTERAIVEGDLDINAGWTVNVGAGNLVAIDREADPTFIFGNLNCAGTCHVLDGNGVITGAGGSVDALSVSMSDGELLNRTEFMAGGALKLGNFSGAGVTNNGMITVADAGIAALLSPNVSNNGVIRARMGKVVLASAETATLDFYGDGLFEVAVSGELADALIENTGRIEAEGGTVQVTALAAKDAVDNVINLDGVVTVASATQSGGTIILSGGEHGTVKVSGTLDASGADGGSVDIDGEVVELADTSEITVDGDDQAGSIVAWGDKLYSYGMLSALGQNGFIETSFRESGIIDGAAAIGENGEYLVDPTNACIADAAASCAIGEGVITTGFIEGLLNSAGINGGFTAQTDGSGVNAGNLRVIDSIDTVTTATGVSFNVNAHNDITINDSITDTGLGLNINLDADFDLSGGDADVFIRANINTNGGNFSAIASDDIDIKNSATVSTSGGNATITSRGTGDGSWLWMPNGGAGTGTINTGNGDVDITVDNINIAAGSSIDAGTGTVSLTRSVDGDISVGDDNGGFHVSQAELNRILAGELVFGLQAGGTDNNIFIDNADTTHVAKTTVSTEIPSGPFDVTFMGTNLTNTLEVNAEDDIIFAAGASLETFGDALFNADADGGTFGDFIMNAGSSIDSNGNNITVETGSAGGGNASHGVFLDAGANIDAEGGNIDFNNDSSFFSVDADSLNTSGTGTIEIEQFDESTIQNAIDAVENTGSGLNTINVHAGTYNESVIVSEDNFLLSGANNGIAGNGVRGPESIVIPNSPGFLVTSNNVTIDGFTVTGGDDGVEIVGADDVTVSNNILQFQGDNGVLSSGATNVNILNNLVANAGDNGIRAVLGNLINIANNVVTNADDDGIHVAGASNITVTGNTVTSADEDGIEFSGVIGGLADGNTVDDSDDQGVEVEGGSAITISNNSVTDSGRQGIQGTSVAGLIIDTNTVTNDSDETAIEVSDSSGVQILANIITEHDEINIDVDNSAGSIVDNNMITDGEIGVQVTDSASSKVRGNTISEIDYGVTLDNSAGSEISGNHLFGNSIIGIDVDSSNGTVVDGNDVHDFETGIEVTNSDAVRVRANTVDNSNTGILADNNGDIWIYNNDVTNAANVGIHLKNSGGTNYGNDSDIWFNRITNPAGAVGILVENSDFATIGAHGTNQPAPDGLGIGNVVTGGIHGIKIVTSDNTMTRYNTVTDTVVGLQNNAIQVTGGTGHTVRDNLVERSGWDGISLFATSNSDILNNTVNESHRSAIALGASLNTLIQGNILNNNWGGMWVGGNNNTTINANFVNGTTTWRGIYISGNEISLEITDNIVHSTADDAIEVNTSAGAQVTGNAIGFTDLAATTSAGVDNVNGEGIDLNNSAGSTISNNTITETTSNGISINPSHGSFITDNNISNTGDHGILSLDSNNITITGNVLNDIGTDGIRFARGNTALIQNNDTTNTGRSGVWAHNSSDVTIDDNDVINAGTATTWSGIVANTNTGFTTITNNRIDTTSNDGIHAGFNPGNVAAANTNVTIDGNTVQNTRVRGIYSVGGTLSVSNNTVHDTTLGQGVRIDNSAGVNIDSNIVYNTGASGGGKDGIEVNNSAGAQITNNAIGFTDLAGTISAGVDNIKGEGIDINNSAGSNISDNAVTETVSNGISINPSPNSFIQGNVISNAGADGINVASSNGTLVGGPNAGDENTITNSFDDGVDVTGSSNVTVQRNVINGTGNNGVEVGGGILNKVLTNDIDNIGWDGIQFVGSTDGQIIGNTIDNVTGASGIAVMGGSHRALVQSNIINGVDRLGIYAWNSNDLDILSNDINDTGREGGPNWFLSGIHLERVNDTLAQGNLIRNTGGDGVHVGGQGNQAPATTTGNEIKDNVIGYTSLAATTTAGDDNINGDGIEADSSTGVIISDNKIIDTTANGIYNKSSNGSTISGNQITSVDENGILVNPSSNVTVDNNTIDNTGIDGIHVTGGDNNSATNNLVGTLGGDNNIGQDGIAYAGSTNGIITGNTVKDTTRHGIQLGSSSGTLIDNNGIENAGLHGMNVVSSANLTVTNNIVDTTGVNNANGNGIQAVGLSGTNLFNNNDVSNTSGHGIQIFNSSGVTVSNNTTDNTGTFGIPDFHGIRILNSAGTIVDTNTVNNTNNGDGIHAENSAFVQVINNLVGLLGGAGNIGQDGVHINGSNNALVQNNTIQNTVANGILVNPSDNVTISYNNIYDITLNGIRVESGTGHNIHHNKVVGTGQNGISLWQTGVSNVHNNLVLLTGGHGISGEYGLNTNVYDNIVGLTYGDGIHMSDTYFTNITDNLVGLTYGNGIAVYGGETIEGYFTNIADNKVLLTGEDGIHVDGIYGGGAPWVVGSEGYGFDYYGPAVNIHGNEVALNGGHGISVTNSGMTRIAYNDVFATGLAFKDLLSGDNEFFINYDGVGFEWGDGDGIHVDNVHSAYGYGYGPDLKVYGNNVSWTGGHGIYAANFGTGYIGGSNEEYGNNIRYAGIDGTFWGWGTVFDQLEYLHDNKQQVIYHGLNSLFGDGNIVTYLKHVIPAPDAVYGDNHDGIHLENFGGAYVGWNDIEFTGDDGISATDGDYIRVTHNWVGKTGIMPWHNDSPEDADGIDINNVGHGSYGSEYGGNYGDGYGYQHYSDYFGGYGGYDYYAAGSVIDNNFVFFAQDDGIQVDGGHSTLIAHNDVGHVNDDGIDVGNVNYSVIKHNAVSMVGDDGIFVDYGYATKIKHNKILIAGDEGIDVQDVGYEDGDDWESKDYDYYNDYFGGWAVDVSKNEVAFTGGHGIQVTNSGATRIARNDIMYAGLGVENFTDMIDWINETAMTTYVGGRPAPIPDFFFEKKWYWGNSDGINVENIHGYGPHGLALKISGNTVEMAGGDGIDASYAGRTLIQNNEVSYAGIDKTKWDYEYRGTYGLTAILDSGLFNDEGRETLWYGQKMNPLIRDHLPTPKGIKFDRYENHDGIRATNIFAGYDDWNDDWKSEGGYDSGHGYGDGYDGQYGPLGAYSLVVYNNKVSKTADDGIEVVGRNEQVDWDNDWYNGTGRTLIADNKVKHAGVKSIRNGHGHHDKETIIEEGVQENYDEQEYQHIRYGNGDEYGADGIHARNIEANDRRKPPPPLVGSYEGNHDFNPYEYSLIIKNNRVKKTADDGIEVVGDQYHHYGYPWDHKNQDGFYYGTGRTLIQGNRVRDAGYDGDYGDHKGNKEEWERDGYGADGIHVRGVFDNGVIVSVAGGASEGGFYGYAVDVLGNNVKRTEDDGIEVLDSESTLIQGNKIRNAGYMDYGYDEGYEGDDYYGYHRYSDADGIHVSNVYGSLGALPGVITENGFSPYAVVIDHNKIKNTADDGIEVNDAGRTRISYNRVKNAGLMMDYGYEGDDYSHYTSGDERYGADGIHVRGITNIYDFHHGDTITDVAGFSGGEGYGYGYDIEIVGNKVKDVASDGIEVRAKKQRRGQGQSLNKGGYFHNTTDLLVDRNEILNAGDNGILLVAQNKKRRRVEKGPQDDIQTLDGDNIYNEYGYEYHGFFNSDIFDNTVENSGWNGLHVNGYGHGDVVLKGNTFINNPTGARFESGRIDVSDKSRPNRFIVTPDYELPTDHYGNPTHDYVTGMQFELAKKYKPQSLTIVDETLGGTIFSGFINRNVGEAYYVRFEDGAILRRDDGILTPAQRVIEIDGTMANWDGLIPANQGGILSPSDLQDIEDRLFDADDSLVNGRGQIFVGRAAQSIDNVEDFFSRFGPFGSGLSGLNLRVTGLPSVGPLGPAGIQPFAGEDVAGIEPAAGGEGEGVADIEPAAGGEDAACWGDVLNAAVDGPVNYNFSSDPTESLNDTANCGSQAL